MTIEIPNNRITIPQMVKLFSNPVSGIACQMDPKSNYNLAHGGYYHLRNIRYSKSMILGALEFWSDQIFKFYLKVTRIYNPLEPTKDVGEEIMEQVNKLQQVMDYVKTVPESYLFSHRYIEEMPRFSNNKGQPLKNDAIKLQLKLVAEKCHLGAKMLMQKTKMDPYFNYNGLPYGIAFTIFPNEHPYVKRQKILEVGKTNMGNTFIIKS